MFKISEIASWIQAKVANPEFATLDAHPGVGRMATLKEAGPKDLAFFFSKHYQDELQQTNAGVVITGTAFVKPLESSGLPQWKKAVFLACEDPYGAMALLSAKFSPLQSTHDHQSASEAASVHPTAVVHPTSKLGQFVDVGAGAVIERDCVVGSGVVIYPGCYVGPCSQIGDGTVLFPRVTLYEKTVIGRNVRIHAGAVIGADGFGYAPLKDPATQKPIHHRKIYHMGRVVIEDFVEIGANSTIDRGTMGDTIIRKNVKIDNQVQIGHNCEVGEGSILCGAAGMAGSSSLGKFVLVLAQAGTGNQVHVGDYSTLMPYAGVAKDCPPESELAGMPARPIRDFFKLTAIQNKMLRDRQKGK